MIRGDEQLGGAIIDTCVFERLKRLARDIDNLVKGVVGVKQAKRGDRRRGIVVTAWKCDPPRIGVELLVFSITTVEFTLVLALNCIFKGKERKIKTLHSMQVN